MTLAICLMIASCGLGYVVGSKRGERRALTGFAGVLNLARDATKMFGFCSRCTNTVEVMQSKVQWDETNPEEVKAMQLLQQVNAERKRLLDKNISVSVKELSEHR